MRFLTFLLFVCFLFSNSPFSYAQGNDTTAKEMKTESVNDGSPFARASDKQIKEAQRYYKKCKSNDNLSKRKDCKCAATTYLETKLKLGDSATVEQILAENINKCLIDKKTKIENAEKIDLKGISKKYIEEAEEAEQWCKKRPRIKTQHDCECLAAKYLEMRIDEGPIISRDEIISKITTQALCKNMVEATGAVYSECMGQSDIYFKNIEPKKYCECYATRWSELFKDYNGVGKKSNLKYYSRMYCLKPSSYK